MNDLAMNSLAEGILTYLKSKTTKPREGMAILGMAICMIYDTCIDPASCPFPAFVEDFRKALIDTHADISSTGPGTIQ